MRLKLGPITILGSAAISLMVGAALTLVVASDISASEPPPIPPNLPELQDSPQTAAPSTERSIDKSLTQWSTSSNDGAVYTYRDGGRTVRLVLEDDLLVQNTSALTADDDVVVRGARDSIVRKKSGEYHAAGPVFRSESGGGLMTLPGGVLLALDPEWDQAQVDGFFSRDNIPTDRTSEVDFVPNGFLVQTGPGFPSLELANALAGRDGVLVSSPNWWREVDANEADDHGDFPATATSLPLGFSVAGRVDPGDDKDVFKLDLSGASSPTDVWIYTTGLLNTVGELSDSTGETLASNNDLTPRRERNFHLRAILPSGVYFVTVSSFWEMAGEYRLHASVATDAGNSIDAATRLSFDTPTTGTIGAAGDADYFKLDLTESMDLILNAESGNSTAIDGVVLDADGTEISVNIFPLPELVHPTADRTGFLVQDELGPGTYHVKVTTSDGVTSHPVPYTIQASADTEYPEFIENCEANTRALNESRISDSLYACQWHLNSREDVDINVEPVWGEGIMGEGVNVAVVDDGLHYTHEDLLDNSDASLNHDYTGAGDIHHPLEHHGTNVAGVIAARDNGIGVRGVAPRATIYGYNYLAGESTDRNLADAMARNRDVTAVSNNSWGPRGGPGLGLASSFWELAVDAGTTRGYSEKGVFYAFGGGNAHQEGDNSNLNELANYYGVTAVCAVDDNDTRSYYSEMGVNLWVCAPSSGGSENRRTVTIENNHRYTDDFGGTSAATPVVAGVVALMRSANPDLTWRDLKLILAASARKNDPGNPGWEDGARKYGSDSTTDRYHFNHEYGFGVVDAKAAVDLAKGWTNLGPLQSSTAQSSGQDAPIPDGPVAGTPTSVRSSLTLDTAVEFIEFMEVDISLRHDSFRDLEIKLESPSGAVSQLIGHFDTVTDDDPEVDFVPLHGSFRFGSARHLGENPSGEWKLHVTDRLSLVAGTLDSWSVTVYGHGPVLGAPSIDSVTSGDGSLTVTWTAPSQTEGLTVDSYDLRYVQTAIDEAVDSNWTVVEDVWTATTGGSLEYTIGALVGGAQYDVQVRAVSGPSVGPWSTTVTGTPAQIVTNECATGRAVSDAANNPRLVSDCNALLAARDALAGSATLNWSANTSITEWEGVTVSGSPSRITGIDLYDSQLTGALPTELSGLTELRRLVLSKNQLTSPIPAWLGDLTNLQVLSLWGNRLSGPIPAELGKLSYLRNLLLSGEQMTGTIPAELGELSNLRWLYLYDSQLTGALPAELSGLTELRRLVLSKNQLTSPIPAWLGDLTNLQVLSLWGNRLSGPIPSELAGLTNLQELFLWGNELTGTIPVWLGDLSKLQLISLSQNNLSGPIPSELGRLTNLQHLYLSNNRLTGTIPSWLGDLANLEALHLRGNRLTGCVPAGLRNVLDNDFDQLGLPFCPLSLPEAPTIGSVTSKMGSLTISWAPPSNDGGSDVTAYDLRHIETTADETVDSNWTVVEDVWTTGGGELEYTVTGLTSDTEYDLQVRAVNAAGDGPWSVTVTGVPTTSFDCVSGGAVADAANAGLASDCAVLIALRDTLAGSASLNWSANTPIAQWEGIGDDSLEGTPPQVVRLYLGGLGLDGAVPIELSSLTELKELYLQDNDLSGPIPSELGELSGLTYLHLQNNDLTGGIPAELGDLAVLRELRLDSNDLTGQLPPELRSLTRVTRLWVADNDLSGSIPAEIGDMANLDWLNLGRNNFSGQIPAELGNLSRMRRLYIYENDLSGPIPGALGNLSRLTHIVAQGNNLSGEIPAELGDLVNLVWLGLHDNDLTGEIPAELGGLAKLQRLYLTNNELYGEVPEELGDLSAVTNLWLNHNYLSGQIPQSLDNLDKLSRLRLAGNRFTGCLPAGLAAVGNSDADQLGLETCADATVGTGTSYGGPSETLGSVAPRQAATGDCATGVAVPDAANNPGLVSDCEALVAAREALVGTPGNADLNWSADTPISEWDGIEEDSLEGSPQRMTRLYLNGLGLGGAIPSGLSGLTALKELYLHDNDLAGPVPPDLGDLSSFTHLHLQNNDLTGGIPAELGDLAVLRELRLDSNDLTGQLPLELGKLTRVTRLWVADNDLSGPIPAEVGGMANLDWLNLGRNNFSGQIPAELGDLARMRRLYIYENDLSGPVPGALGSLSRLTHIVAQANDLSSQIPTEVGNLSSFVWIGLHDNDLTGEIPAELGSLAKLQRLYLTNNELYGEVPGKLGDLSALTNLWLNHNYLSGQIPQSLDNLEKLSRLRLAGNRFTGCLPAGLAAVSNSDVDQLDMETCADS